MNCPRIVFGCKGTLLLEDDQNSVGQWIKVWRCCACNRSPGDVERAEQKPVHVCFGCKNGYRSEQERDKCEKAHQRKYPSIPKSLAVKRKLALNRPRVLRVS